MSKFRHLVGHIQTLIGYGPVGPHEVIETHLDLSSSPNFEAVATVEPVEVTDAVAEPAVAPEPVISKKKIEPVVAETPPPAVPEVEA